MQLNSWRKRRVLTSTVHITNNPWTLFCISVYCPGWLDKWFWTNTVFKPESGWQGLHLAGRCTIQTPGSCPQRSQMKSQIHFSLARNPKRTGEYFREREKVVPYEFLGLSGWGFGGRDDVVFHACSSQQLGGAPNVGCSEEDFRSWASHQAYFSQRFGH